MIMFWITAALMLVLAYLFFLPALLGKPRADKVSRARLNLALHRQRQQELSLEATSPEDLSRLTAESERNLLGDLETGDTPTNRPQRAGLSAVYVALALLPLAAWLAYTQWGRPDLLENPPAKAMADAKEAIDGLAQRLQQNPNDLDGWVLLGRSLQATQRPAEAAKAFEFALKLSPGNLELKSYWAETLAEANQGNLAGRPLEIVKEILSADPRHKAALWLAGLAAAQSNQIGEAMKYWKTLQAEYTPGSPEALEITDFIAKLEADSAATSNPPPPQAAETGKRLHVKVTLADELKQKTLPEDTVFIFAKAAEGPPMPLAVVKKQVKDLPLEVMLDDSMSMMQGMNLSAFERLVIGARVSKSGRPVPSPGDFEGLTEPVSPGQEAHYNVTIQRVIPDAKP
jgi:cytochrome c-type biogenesis protein CcmH